MRAHELLEQAQFALRDRSRTRDENSERSMGLAVSIFGAMTGRSLSELDGWRFMIALKLARAARGQCHVDDWIDLAGYAALSGECQLSERARALEVYAATRDPERDDDEGTLVSPVNQSDED